MNSYNRTWFFCGFLVLNLLFLCKVNGLDNGVTNQCTFRAAVYEQQLISTLGNAFQTMTYNLDLYQEQSRVAAEQGSRIIVFMEYGITGFGVNSSVLADYLQWIPDPHLQSWNPCNEDFDVTNETMVAYRLSCMARNNSILVVANLLTYVNCSDTVEDPSCSQPGMFYYNTNVAFASNGTLVARYHKYNLYDEPGLNVTSSPEIVTLDTEFGRFGFITCFDAIWKDPTVSLVVDRQVDTLVFPTAWVDGMPFGFALQVQSSIARALKVNLLAANIHDLRRSVGSGIFAGGSYGPVNYTCDSRLTEGRVVVGDLPCQPRVQQNVPSASKPVDMLCHRSANQGNFYFPQRYFSGVFIHDTVGFAEVCNGSFCCWAHYHFSPNNSFGIYWLGAVNVTFKAFLPYSSKVIAMEMCSFFWCEKEDVSTCYVELKNSSANSMSIHSLLLAGNFTSEYVYPSVLEFDNLSLMPVVKWTYAVNELSKGFYNAYINITSPTDPVSFFGANLFGRAYDREHLHTKNN